MAHAWLTPDNLPTTRQCWRVFVPDGWQAFLWGALHNLAKVDNWEEHGSVTPEEAAYAWLTANFETFQAMENCSTGEGGGTVSKFVGEVFWMASDNQPEKSLLCDGSEYSTTTYSLLYNEVGYIWGGTGSVFNVPDLVDRGIFGAGNEYALGDYGGQKEVTLTVDTSAPHHHGLYPSGASGATVPVVTPTGKSLAATVLTTDTGGGQPHENMPPFAAMLPYIYAGE